jgi:hypothetical protein
MTLPKIYEDAINCFCPRTARMMRSSISRYITTGIIKISSRICTAPKAVLILIIHDIHQNFKYSLTERKCSSTEEKCSLNEENCSLTEKKCSLTEENCSLTEGCSLTEEEIKRRNRDGKNIVSLPPTPSIIDTRKGEKREEKTKEEFIAREENNNNNSAREEKILHSENKTLKDLGNDFHSSIPLEKSLALIYPDDPAEIFRLKLLKKTRDEQHRQMEELSQCNQLIDYYNKCVGIRLQQVIERYPALIQTARMALDALGPEKAKYN